MIVKCWPDFGVFGERDRESTRWRETQQGKVKERERESSLWQESSRSVMVTWQKGGESLSVLPLLCLKIWHLHSQQQQWCNLVTRLWHVYSRPKPGSYLPYQRLYIQRGRSSCFPSDCRGGDKQGGVGTLLTCPSVKGETPHFFHPWSQKDLWGYFKDLSN